jgi:hypothetical protein
MIKNYKYLDAYIPWDGCIEDMEFGDNRYDQFESGDLSRFINDWPSLYYKEDGEDYIHFKIDMLTGKVINWPEGFEGNFTTVKVVDGGTYVITDENGEIILKYDGYVPELLSVNEKGYGDYLEFEIDKNSMIPGWRVTNELLQDFEDNA